MITQKQVKQHLHYDPETGIFTRKIGSRGCRVGDVAGGLDGRGYISIWLLGKRYKAHRLAWFCMTGAWPKIDIDHKNLIRHENWWDNLREATKEQNRANAKYQEHSTPYKGVSWVKKHKNFKAGIKANGRRVHLGCFSTAEEAYAAYCKAATEHFGEFARFK